MNNICGNMNELCAYWRCLLMEVGSFVWQKQCILPIWCSAQAQIRNIELFAIFGSSCFFLQNPWCLGTPDHGVLKWGWKGPQQTCDLGCFSICLLFCWNFQCAKFQVKFSNLRLVKLSIAEHRSIFWCMRNIIDHWGKYRITNEITVSLFKYSHNFIYSCIFLKGMGVCCTVEKTF